MSERAHSIEQIIAPTVAALGYELVRVVVSGQHEPLLQVMAERADGKAMTVEDCADISHALSAVLDVEDPIKSRYRFEVSSPGIDRPLTRKRDYERFAGHAARLETAMPIDGRRRFKGQIEGLDGETVRLRLEDGSIAAIPLGSVARAKLVLTPELIAAHQAT